jgi:hypothetical protein
MSQAIAAQAVDSRTLIAWNQEVGRRVRVTVKSVENATSASRDYVLIAARKFDARPSSLSDFMIFLFAFSVSKPSHETL